MKRNRGEEYEVFLKTYLLMKYTKGQPISGKHNIGKIEQLSFSPDGDLPEWKNEYELMLKKRDYIGLKKVFPKAPTGSKADLEINYIKYSVKNSLGAKSAIVNHTNRKGFLRIFELLKMDITKLDKIIDEYWIKRKQGIIREDTSNSSEDSPFREHKEYLKPIIEYFLFTGTGSNDSEYQADKMLIFDEPENTENYKILEKSEAVDLLWPSLVFSLRSKKGMPSKYTKEDCPEIAPWVNYVERNEFPKGALHIRS